MARVDVVVVPGLGVLRAFKTESGERLATLTLPSGRRQLFVQVPDDPDQRRLVADLTESDSQVLAELLGGSLLQMHAPDRPNVATVLDWVRIPHGSAGDGTAITGLDLGRSRATIAAVLRNDDLIGEPAPDLVLQADDVVILAGGTDDLAGGREALTKPRRA